MEYAAQQHQLGALRSILRHTLSTSGEEGGGADANNVAEGGGGGVALMDGDAGSANQDRTSSSDDRMQFLSAALDAMTQDAFVQMRRWCAVVESAAGAPQAEGKVPDKDALIHALNNLMEECYDIDQALSLIPLGVMKHIVKLLRNEDAEIQEKAAKLISISSQNNGKVVRHVYGCGAVAPLCNMLKTSSEGKVVAAVISALSMLVHEQPDILEACQRMRVFEGIGKALESFRSSTRVKQKASFMVLKCCNSAGDSFRAYVAQSAPRLVENLARLSSDDGDSCHEVALQAAIALAVCEEARTAMLGICPSLESAFQNDGLAAAEQASRDAATARAQAEQSNASAVRFGDNNVDSGNNVFVPSAEWREVPEGMHIPSGLEVRMNFTTGKKFARLLQKEPDGAKETALVAKQPNEMDE